MSLSMILFSFVALLPLIYTIKWNGNWAFSCDFKGSDLKNVRVRGEDCGGRCTSTPGCTHFTWTKYQGGTCWMKKGGASKANAIDSRDRSMVCGVVERHGKGGKKDSDDIINSDTFACAFNTIDASSRNRRLNGLKETGWKPKNKDEAAVFLAHVFHETAGLKSLTEHCAPGCGGNYASSWCEIQGRPGKLYYGRGWFQLSWPCNYHKAGQALGVDLLADPDRVASDAKLAVNTALWYYRTNGMAEPAQRGDFAKTTKIINGKMECGQGSARANQNVRVATYKRIRHCFGLGEPKINPTC